MSTSTSPNLHAMSRREIEDYLVERCLLEDSFRVRLLSNPKETLRGLGLDVSDTIDVRVLEESPKCFYIVLPRVLNESPALDDQEMDSLSGGTSTPAGTVSDFFAGYV
ncbi:MAG: NHLP leader peptide family RiPP precursor [Terrimicrobiaceae bacterium]|nr:NHLP leader peptide family RiPP precursor [Terrimicrobiaceae bacterium]